MSANSSLSARKLAESAVLIAIGTVLSFFAFPGFWVLGGSITFCSMLPLVVLSWRYGVKWGTFCAFIFSLIQMLLGIANVQYADSVFTAILIILFDYVVAFSVLGLAALFKGKLANPRMELVLGITCTMLLRLACHFVSGVVIWEALWPNELGWAAPIWSIAYNASFMIPEIIITSLVAVLSYNHLEKFYQGK